MLGVLVDVDESGAEWHTPPSLPPVPVAGALGEVWRGPLLVEIVRTKHGPSGALPSQLDQTKHVVPGGFVSVCVARAPIVSAHPPPMSQF